MDSHSYSPYTEFVDQFAGKKVLITGATGFIGWQLCKDLMTLGAEVHGLSRSASPQTVPPGCKPWAVNLIDIDATREVVTRVKPSLIYHLAGLVTARQELDLILPMLQTNLVGTVHLLLSLAETGCDRLIVTGSSEELSTNISGNIPVSPYATAKVAANVYAGLFFRIYDLPVVIARPFMTYGPRQEPKKLIPSTILALLRGEAPRVSSGKRVIDFVYLPDVVRGLLKMGVQPDLAGKTVDLGTGTGCSVKDVVMLIVRLSDSSIQPLFGAVPDRIEESSQIANIKKSERLIGWEPKWALEEGLIETINWYREMERISGSV